MGANVRGAAEYEIYLIYNAEQDEENSLIWLKRANKSGFYAATDESIRNLQQRIDSK